MTSPAHDLVGTVRTAFSPQSSSASVVGALKQTTKPAETLPQIPQAITAFLDVEVQARMAPTREALRFVMVNAVRRVVPFETAILLEQSGAIRKSRRGWQATAASDVVSIDRDSGFLRALEMSLTNRLATSRFNPGAGQAGPEVMPFDSADALAEIGLPHALLLPLSARNGEIMAVLVCFGQQEWTTHAKMLLGSMAAVFAHAWDALSRHRGRSSAAVQSSKSRLKLLFSSATVLCVAFGLMVPVPMQVYAPAEVVAASPSLVTSPLDGIIADVHVQPGSMVSAGTLLASFTDTKLRNDAELAQRNLDIAETKLFRLTQSATANRRDTADLAAAQAELTAAQAELAYAREMLGRAQVHAAQSGLVIFGAKSDWIGKPVQTGERIMEIVDPTKAELRIDVPLADSMPLAIGNAVRLHLDGDPLNTIKATVQRTSYRAQLTGDRQLAFRTFAAFPAEREPLRIGLRGTARISGPSVTLWFYLFRRPIAALRQRIGF